MKNTLNRILRERLGSDEKVVDVVKLHGDASYRTYYRAKLSGGNTCIVMQMPAGKASVSEEITNFKGTHDELPFVNIARYLEGRGMPVPKILCYSEPDRIMILEDLGDDLMAKRVSGAGEAVLLEWYRKAIELLRDIQTKTSGGTQDACIAFRRSFDATLLNWEFDHFLEYGIGKRLKRPMDDRDLGIFSAETRAISSKIGSLQYGFTHRDFQSRNLIIKDGRLHIIDFQDALMGPAAYDLVALLRDSYVKLSDAVLDDLISHYAQSAGIDVDKLSREFDLITVQRKLKDAGRFVFIDRVKGNPNFLQYIPTSLSYVRGALQRLPEHKRLHDLLMKYVPEWR